MKRHGMGKRIAKVSVHIALDSDHLIGRSITVEQKYGFWEVNLVWHKVPQ